MGLYQEIRPKKLEDVVGQPAAVAQLQSMLAGGKLPHVVLFSGPSGTGKTTLARILCDRLGCTALNIIEKNCASDNGIDFVRDIQARMPLKPFSGARNVYIIDEAHQLTSAASRALLKTLEDTPEHVYFFLCTTNPEKLEKPLISRCTHIKLQSVPLADIRKLLEPFVQGPANMRIAAAADGSPRRALVMAEQYMAVGDEHLDAILDSGETDKPDLFEVVKALYRGDSWGEILRRHGKVLKEMSPDAVEGLRLTILSYGQTMLLGGSLDAAEIMEFFVDPFFNSKKPGFVLALFKATCVE